jgi:hypothetical protein
MTPDSLPQDWPAYKEGFLKLQQDVEHLREQMGIVPVLSNNIEDLHARVVAAEESNVNLSDHHSGAKTRQVAALGGVGAVGLGAGNLTEILEFLSKLFGG